MPRIYIAGPMSGLPEFNYPAFNAMAARLRSLGYEVENPAENPTPPCGSWQGFMRLGLTQVLRCDQMIMLPGWEKSHGARLEHYIATTLGLTIITDPADERVVERWREPET